MQLNDDKTLLFAQLLPTIRHQSVIFIDFDSTLFVRNGARWPGSDVQPIVPVINALRKAASSADVIIVTNQKITPKVTCEMINERLINGINALSANGINVAGIYAALGTNSYRKPMPGVIDRVFRTFNLAPKQVSCLMVGDAAGRAGDHSCCDRQFAYNANVLGYRMEFETPETFAGILPVESFTWPIDPSDIESMLYHGGNKPLFQFSLQPEVVVMCGLPGSGKTTIAKEFEAAGYVRISGDDFGNSRARVTAEMNKEKHRRKSIVIDRIHATPETRAEYIQFAADRCMPCRAIWIDCTPQWAYMKMSCRYYCEYGPRISSVVYNMNKIVPPTTLEGFDSVEYNDGRINLDKCTPLFVKNIRMLYESL